MPKRKRKRRTGTTKRKTCRKRKRKGKKMPPKVLAYFKYRSAGLSKTAAKKKAGL